TLDSEGGGTTTPPLGWGSASGQRLVPTLANMDGNLRDELEFDRLVGDALDALPDDIRAQMSNVAVTVADEPPPGQPLLGLYEGIPLGRRGGPYYPGVLPDKITIYRGPIQRVAGGDPVRLRASVQ